MVENSFPWGPRAAPQWIWAEAMQSWNEVSLWIFAPNKVTHFPRMAMALTQLTRSSVTFKDIHWEFGEIGQLVIILHSWIGKGREKKMIDASSFLHPFIPHQGIRHLSNEYLLWEVFLHYGHLKKVKSSQVLDFTSKALIWEPPVNHCSQPCIQKHSDVGPSQLD